jgi:hypothetical protein
MDKSKGSLQNSHMKFKNHKEALYKRKKPIFGLQACIIRDRVEVSPPEIARKKSIVVGHPAKRIIFRLSFSFWPPCKTHDACNLSPFQVSH